MVNASRAGLKASVRELCAALANLQDQQQVQDRHTRELRDELERANAAAAVRSSSVLDDTVLRNLSLTVKFQSETIGRLLSRPMGPAAQGGEDREEEDAEFGFDEQSSAVDEEHKVQTLSRLVKHLQLHASDVHLLATQNRLPARAMGDQPPLLPAREEQRLRNTIREQQRELDALRDQLQERSLRATNTRTQELQIREHASQLRKLRLEHRSLLEQVSGRGPAMEQHPFDDHAGEPISSSLSASFERELAQMQQFLQTLHTQMHEVRARAAGGGEVAATLAEAVARQSTDVARLGRECAQLHSEAQLMREETRRLRDEAAELRGAAAQLRDDAVQAQRESRQRDKAGLAELHARNAELVRELDRLRERCRSLEAVVQSEAAATADREYYAGFAERLRVRLQETHLRLIRSERFRKALMYQKKYLLLLHGGFQEPEQQTLAIIARPTSPLDPLARFRGAATVVVAAQRLRSLAHKWHVLASQGTARALLEH